MRIMVFDVPAASGGALTILNQYYDIAIKDELNEWIFVVSTPQLKGSDNVKIFNYPWIKKSWVHRLFFDLFIAPLLVKNNNIDKILSLQNIIVPRTKVYQILYVHQSIPFSDIKFNITKEPILWIYKNMIGKYIFKSIQKADKVIFQTKWMKEICLQKVKVDSNKIYISRPKVNIDALNIRYEKQKEIINFFYPANACSYKNHKILLDASIKLKQKGINNFSIILTLSGNENKTIKLIDKISAKNKLGFKFIGVITRNEVFELYKHTILLFPSYLETFGLPLLEARLVGTPILASDCPYAKEVLEEYKNAFFFKWNNPNDLATKMEYLINNKVDIQDRNLSEKEFEDENLIGMILNNLGDINYESDFIN